jgi:4-hydroxybenzoate polyprenyltransferase
VGAETAGADCKSSAVSFDPTWLFLSMIPSGIGFVLFVYGKKQQRWPHLVAGLVLAVYPYLATTVTSLVVVGTAICLALWLAVRAGW